MKREVKPIDYAKIDPAIRENVVQAMDLLDDAGFTIDGPNGGSELAEQLYGIATQIERVLDKWPVQ